MYLKADVNSFFFTIFLSFSLDFPLKFGSFFFNNCLFNLAARPNAHIFLILNLFIFIAIVVVIFCKYSLSTLPPFPSSFTLHLISIVSWLFFSSTEL